MNEGSTIEALSLTKVYGGKAAVDGIDFQVKPGMVTGFLGPNGAGKPVTELRRSSVRPGVTHMCPDQVGQALGS
jgi:ABC-type branched-subunit amino acid transport system ATPase component